MIAFAISIVLVPMTHGLAKADEGPEVILAGSLLDVESGRLIDNALIKVENGVIEVTIILSEFGTMAFACPVQFDVWSH